jgi:hypothetical protein
MAEDTDLSTPRTGITCALEAVDNQTMSKIQGHIVLRIVPQPIDLPRERPNLGDVVDRANQSLKTSGRHYTVLDTSEQVASNATMAIDTACTAGAVLEPLLGQFEVFMKAIDRLGNQLAEVSAVRCYIIIFHLNPLVRCILTSKQHGPSYPSHTRFAKCLLRQANDQFTPTFLGLSHPA